MLLLREVVGSVLIAVVDGEEIVLLTTVVKVDAGKLVLANDVVVSIGSVKRLPTFVVGPIVVVEFRLPADSIISVLQETLHIRGHDFLTVSISSHKFCKGVQAS
jgi:hypothetical protein